MLYEVTVDGKKDTFHVDGWLYQKITHSWLPAIKRDDDFVAVVDGQERSGKTVFGTQLAKVMDPNFDLSRVCMTANEFRTAIINARKGDAVVYDEAFTGLSSKGALTEVNKILVELMMEMGQKNLKVIIILPTFFMLEKYVAIFRAKCLFHIYKKHNMRGYWMYFGKKKKKLLYLLGKKFMSYSQPQSERRGRFTNFYTINEEKYRLKKHESFTKKDRRGRDERTKEHRDFLMWFLNHELGISMQNLSDICEKYGHFYEKDSIAKIIKAFDERREEENTKKPEDDYLLGILTIIMANNRISTKKRQLEAIKKEAAVMERRQKRLKKQINPENILNPPFLDEAESENKTITPDF